MAAYCLAVRADYERAHGFASAGKAEVDAFGHRVAELAADPTYPLLDDWDGRPFEWW